LEVFIRQLDCSLSFFATHSTLLNYKHHYLVSVSEVTMKINQQQIFVDLWCHLVTQALD